MRQFSLRNGLRFGMCLLAVSLAAAIYFVGMSNTVASQEAAKSGQTRQFGPVRNDGPIGGGAISFSESPAVSSLPVLIPEPVAPDELGLTRRQLKKKRDSLIDFDFSINKNNRKIIRGSDPNGGAGAVDLFIDGALKPSAAGRRRLAPEAPMPPPALTFDSPNAGEGILPPDTTGDVGVTQYVQQTNGARGTPFTVFNKTTGAVTAGPIFMESLWPAGDPCAIGGTTSGDPVVLYDSLADRWFLSQFTAGTDPHFQCIAISRTPDATGSYFIYTFLMPNSNFQDYPHYGVWPDGYYLAANQFANFAGDDLFNGAGFFAFDRVKMLRGDATASYIYFNKDDGCRGTGCSFGGFLPTDLDGVLAPPAGMPNLFLTFNADEFGATDRVDGFLFDADFDTPANSTLTTTNQVPLAPFDARSPVIPPPNQRAVVEQFGGTNLDAIGDRLMHRLAYRNLGSQAAPVNAFSGTFTVNVSGVNPTSAATYQTAPRWFELRGTNTLAGGSGLSMYDQGTHAPDAGNGASGTNRWMQSISQDHDGRLALGFSASSTTRRADIVWAGRDTGAATGTMNATETLFYAAAGSQTAPAGRPPPYRWGDYSTLTTDPVDDCTFYFTQEVYNFSSPSLWDTRIGYAKFPQCSAVDKGTISGTITACSTGAPIEGVTITATGGFSRLTDPNGTFSIVLGPGSYGLTISRPGFRTASTASVNVTSGGGTGFGTCLTSVATLAAGTATIVSESCLPANGAVDPGETVTVSLPVTNTGTTNTVSDVGTLQTTGGVTSPGPAQNYGTIIAGGPPVSRNFTFTADPSLACGVDILATVAHVDNSGSLGTVSYTIPSGAVSTILSENFDSVTPPNLPAGWTATNAAGPAPLWVTATGANHTPPNVAFVDGPGTVSDKRLDTPAFVPAAGSQVSFRHFWSLETGFDGGVLEISVAGGAFQDIVAAGGAFLSGGYNGTISTQSLNPIGGRSAWTGTPPSFVTTTVRLPAAAASQSVVLRFRMASDQSVGGPGWRVDTFSVTSRSCCTGGPTPTPTPTPSPTPSPPCTPSNQIADGGFEENRTGIPVTNPNWASTSNSAGTALCNIESCGTGGGTTPPRTGDGWVWFDGTGTGVQAENATVSQTVFIPRGTATLSYFLRIGAVTAPSSSVLTVRVDGNVVQTITEPATAETAYTERTVNISAYADGGIHSIQFAYNRPAGTSASDGFAIDDVSLQFACATTAAITGRVRTTTGTGLRSVTVIITNLQAQPLYFATTNTAGFYTFPSVPLGQAYRIRVSSRRYKFPIKPLPPSGGLMGPLDIIFDPLE